MRIWCHHTKVFIMINSKTIFFNIGKFPVSNRIPNNFRVPLKEVNHESNVKRTPRRSPSSVNTIPRIIFEENEGEEDDERMFEKMRELDKKKKIGEIEVNLSIYVCSIAEICYLLGFSNHTFHEAIDTFLWVASKIECEKMKKWEVFVCAALCLFIASKYEEVNHLFLKDLVQILHQMKLVKPKNLNLTKTQVDKFLKNYLIKMEVEVLEMIGFEVNRATPLYFVREILEIDSKEMEKNLKFLLSIFFVEICFTDPQIWTYHRLTIAKSCVNLSNYILDGKITQKMELLNECEKMALESMKNNLEDVRKFKGINEKNTLQVQYLVRMFVKCKLTHENSLKLVIN